MSSFCVRFLSSTCTWISLSHDWKIKLPMADDSPLSLILVCAVRKLPAPHLHFVSRWIYCRGYLTSTGLFFLWGTKMLLSLASAWCSSRVDVQSAHGGDVKVTKTWYTANIGFWEPHQRQFTTLTSQLGTHPNPPDLGVSIILVWAITSWWWDQVSALHFIQGRRYPVLPQRAGTNLTPWYGEVRLLWGPS